MKTIDHYIKESAVKWGISEKLATWIFWLPVVGGCIIVITRLYMPLFRFLVREDGVVEWMQFFGYVFAMLFSLGIAVRRFQTGHRWQSVMFFGLAALLFLIAGEEISWGQRIFHIQTPVELDEINSQHEMNFHNIGDILDYFNVGMMIASGIACSAFIWNRFLRLERFGDRADFLFCPPFFIASAFFLTFAYKFIRLTVWPQDSFTVTRIGEWGEFCLVYGICLFTGLNYRLLALQAKMISTQASVAQEQPLIHQKV